MLKMQEARKAYFMGGVAGAVGRWGVSSFLGWQPSNVNAGKKHILGQCRLNIRILTLDAATGRIAPPAHHALSKIPTSF